jgi:GH24 family phage-related lysozyme (muramidase)
MSNPVRLADLFRFYKHGLPHQMAAITELQEAMLKADPRLLDRDQPWFKTWSQSGKQPEPIYLAPAEKIIKEFEGCRLTAYKCPAGVWTIGWGATNVNGSPVREGDKISQALADELLRAEIHRFADKLHQLIPASANWGANQQAALISWMYNVGAGAVETSTLRKRINAGEAAPVVVRQELPKWRHAGEAVLAGLERRRAAEVALFTGTSWVPQQPAPKFTPSSPFSTLITPHIAYGELCLGEERRRFTNQGQCDIATELCTFLEKARAQFGNKPLIITSGHRPQQVNQAVGGASNSEHLYKPGCGAIDWYIQGVAVLTVQNWCAKNWPYSTGLGAPKGFIHTGIRAGRPKVVWDY